MNRKQVKKYIDKINALNNSILADEAYSEMETDLLESYVKSLLEAVTERKVIKPQTPPPPPPQEVPVTKSTLSEPEVIPTPPPSQEVPVIKSALSEPEITPTPPPSVQEAANISPKKAEEKKVVEPKIESKPTPPPAPPVEEIEAVPEVKPKILEPHLEELEELFEHQAVKELSDKLKMQPIKDLTSAISINERIFTTQELFGGDQKKFNDTISHLNAMASYEDAKKYLIDGIANENEWYTKKKQKKAAQFILLIKRRFSAN